MDKPNNIIGRYISKRSILYIWHNTSGVVYYNKVQYATM